MLVKVQDVNSCTIRTHHHALGTVVLMPSPLQVAWLVKAMNTLLIVTVRITWKDGNRWIAGMTGRMGSSAQTMGVEFNLSGEGIARPDEK